ncbi:MAG: hypothetical protein P9M08_05355, partial [Candidatus Erginobacter occultus]|nr:hypothetical protein [Candidatus Erginobacter occultus]
ILGLDYTWNLFPGLPGFFSLNRFLFLGVLFLDLLLYSDKYLRAGKIYLIWSLILIGCLPYLLFDSGDLESSPLNLVLKLIGSFAYLLFFYVNCQNGKIAGRISTILMLSTGVLAVYVLGGELGMFGGKIHRWRGAVEFTSASGIFDPNVFTLYYLPVFAFAPFLRLRVREERERGTDLFSVIFVCFCLVTFFFLNTRAGSLGVAAALAGALFLRLLIVSGKNGGGRWPVMTFSALVVGALIYANIQYDLLGPIIGIWGETDLATDTSFATRLSSYRYLANDLLTSPNLFGVGYRDFWLRTGWQYYWPHSVFVDCYLQGGLLFLISYLGLYLWSVTVALRGVWSGRDRVGKSCFAGFFCFLAGLLPLTVTLSIGGYKLPWAIMGCTLGLAAARLSGRGDQEAD